MTGASHGIGEALAQRLARDGWDLVLVARSRPRLEACRELLLGLGATRVHVVAADLALPHAAQAVFEEVSAAGLQIDLLVNNAGQGGYGDFRGQDAQIIERMMRLNVDTPTALARLLLPAMVARRSGTLLQIASTAALRPGPQLAVYTATKAFLVSLTQSLASELAGTGVRVLAVCPGPTRTGFRSAAGLVEPEPAYAASATSVADFAVDAIARRGVVFTQGTRNRLLATVTPLVPARILAWLVRRRRSRSMRGTPVR